MAVTHVLAAARVVVLLLLGVVVGSAAVAVHGLTPGLLLGLAAAAAAGYALPAGWTWRFPFGAGWGGVVALAALPRGTGSYLVAGNVRGWTLLVGTLVLVLFSAVTAVQRPSRPASNAGSEGSVS